MELIKKNKKRHTFLIVYTTIHTLHFGQQGPASTGTCENTDVIVFYQNFKMNGIIYGHYK